MQGFKEEVLLLGGSSSSTRGGGGGSSSTGGGGNSSSSSSSSSTSGGGSSSSSSSAGSSSSSGGDSSGGATPPLVRKQGVVGSARFCSGCCIRLCTAARGDASLHFAAPGHHATPSGAIRWSLVRFLVAGGFGSLVCTFTCYVGTQPLAWSAAARGKLGTACRTCRQQPVMVSLDALRGCVADLLHRCCCRRLKRTGGMRFAIAAMELLFSAAGAGLRVSGQPNFGELALALACLPGAIEQPVATPVWPNG